MRSIGRPNFYYERELWQKNCKVVIGVDEVGRGSFAGPLVVGCVSYSPDILTKPHPLINDSKKLSAKQRLSADRWIRKNSTVAEIGWASVGEINKVGVGKATYLAVRRAVSMLKNVDFMLVDAIYIPYVVGLGKDKQKSIIKGDSISFSIASASIVAKVYRDRFMVELTKIPKYSIYSWHTNKGYGTKEHRMAIQRHGVCDLHRSKFVSSTIKLSVNYFDRKTAKSQTS